MLHALLHIITYLLGTMKKEEKLLPTVYLDYKSMVAHEFIVKNREGALKYKLFFDKHHPETITLPAPSLFNLSEGPYLVPWAAVQAYWNPTPARSRNHNLSRHDSLITFGIRR